MVEQKREDVLNTSLLDNFANQQLVHLHLKLFKALGDYDLTDDWRWRCKNSMKAKVPALDLDTHVLQWPFIRHGRGA